MSDSSTHQLVGVVTKMFPTFGYINNQIFFQRKCVIGPMVEVGDDVAASAVYQPNMPIKWSAEKVWRVQESRSHPKNDTDEKKWAEKPRAKSPAQQRELPPHVRDTPTPRDTIASNAERKRRDLSERRRSPSRDLVLSDKGDYKRRRLSPTSSVRSRSPRRQTRVKNECEAKALLNVKEMIIPDIHFRFPGLLAPVDLYRLVCHWQDSFPLLKPLQPERTTCFQVLKATPAESNSKAKIDSGFFVNVLLLSMPSMNSLHDKTITRAEGPNHEKPPVRKYIKLLSVSRPKEQFKAFGGPWNEELDGPEPLNNPEVLINTAIRICKEQIGLDLSYCTQWHRFLEFRYSRTEGSTARPTSVLFPGSQLWGRSFTDTSHKTSNPMKPFHRIVIYFIPDIWSIMPSSDKWADMMNAMEVALSGGSTQNFPISPVELKALLGKQDVSDPVSSKNDSSGKNRDTNESSSDITEPAPVTQSSNSQKANVDSAVGNGDMAAEQLEDSVQKEEHGLKSPSSTSGGVDEDGGNKVSRKSFEELNLSAMKVSELREQLKARNLPADGIKAQLLSRLKTAVEKEAEQAKKIEEERKRKERELQEALAAKDEEDKKKESLKSAERAPTPKPMLSKVSLRNYPSIVIQNRLHTDYTIQAVSLDSILETKSEAMDSRAYELIICAHNLLDMLRRDAIFTLFRALVSAGDRGVQAKARPKIGLEKHDRGTNRNRDSKSESTKDAIPFTVDVPLLFACTHLDPARREYFTSEDVEDMISTLGLPVSRYQIRSLTTKVSDSHRVYYRSLTDAEVSPSTVRSTSLYSEIDDDEYLLELIRGGDAILDEQKDTHLPLGSVLILRDSAANGLQSSVSDTTTPSVFAENLRALEFERNKLKKQLQNKSEEIDRLRVLAERIPNLKEKLESTTNSVEDYRRRLRVERDRIHYVHRILEQQIDDLDSSRTALKQAVHRLRAHDEESSSSRKNIPETKVHGADIRKQKSEEKPSEVTTDTAKEQPMPFAPPPEENPTELSTITKDNEDPVVDVASEPQKLTDTVMDISISVIPLKSPECKMVNGLDGDDEVANELVDTPMNEADGPASSIETA